MNNQLIFDFQTDLLGIVAPDKLNNPFGSFIPKIARIAAEEFQHFISSESQQWKYDFRIQKGKMFGVLVVQKADDSYGYLGTISGKIPNNATCEKLIPSIFDTSKGDFFLDKGMTELTKMGIEIEEAGNQVEINSLAEKRRQKSFALQQRLFDSYLFLSINGIEKSVTNIFKNSSHGNPPSAAGECAAPKLLQYAFKHHLKPIALAEFWWGNLKNTKRVHKTFYPACKHKCRPILEYMLCDQELFNQASV